MADVSGYFYNGPKAPDSGVWAEIKAANGSYNFLSTAKIDPPANKPVPEGVEDIGFQTRLQYEELVSSVKVLLGIGAPTISPSVYSALLVSIIRGALKPADPLHSCQGVPVVLPYFKQDPTPPGWALFSE